MIRPKALCLGTIIMLLGFTSPGRAVDRLTRYLIKKEIEKHAPEIIKIRRFLHMNPELANREFETSKLIASKLLSWGFEVKTGIAHTGVLGVLKGSDAGFTIGYRADMDAFPLSEKTRLSYASLNPGIMHAQGHDIHVAVGLGTALILSRLKDRMNGNIKFIFQPAQAGPPLNEEGGAALMIKEGALEDPPIRAVFGLQVWPECDVGRILYSPGPVLAGADTFSVVLRRNKDSDAHSQTGPDTVVLAAQTVIALQTVIQQARDSSGPVAVTMGKIQGGRTPDTYADEVRLEGTIRILSEIQRTRIQPLIRNVLDGVTRPYGASYELVYTKGLSPIYNHPDLSAVLLPTLHGLLGGANVLPLTPMMFADDFSEFSEKVPGFYFLLGGRSPGRKSVPSLFSPEFNPDERSISIGIEIMTHLLLDCLSHMQDFAAGS